MRRFLTLAAVLVLIAFSFVFAADKPQTTAPIPPRIPEMSTAGTVLELSSGSLRIERKLKGKSEVMEFSLESPLANVAAGDSVRVSYRERDGRNVLIRLSPAKKTAVKNVPKKELPKEVRPVAPAVQ